MQHLHDAVWMALALTEDQPQYISAHSCAPNTLIMQWMLEVSRVRRPVCVRLSNLQVTPPR